jgi:two-component system sensor histidine kinase KdpD
MQKPDSAHFLKPGISAWVIVLTLLSIGTASGLLLDQHISLVSQAMLYVLVVVVASYALSFLPSVVCAVGAVTAFNFFFVPPRWTFAVDSDENLIALLVMLLVALVINHLVDRLRRQTKAAHLNALRASQLQELAIELGSAMSNEDVLDRGVSAIQRAFSNTFAMALLSSDSDVLLPPPHAAIADGMRCCMREAAVLGPGTGRWPGLNAWYLPIGARERMYGALYIGDVVAADEAGREHALALCALLSQSLWRIHLMQTVQASKAESERQQVQSTYLAAISHDLRTPLASVLGAATSLQVQHEKLSRDEQDRLLATVVRETAYLSTLTENTLQLVQLTNAPRGLRRDWESVEEIVGAVVARLRERDPARRIRVKVPDDLPLIQADPVLLAQLIGNLLDNALKYSTEGIELAVYVQDGQMQVSVKDRGDTIPLALQQHIFEPYARGDRSGQRGAGLGLALCRAIAAAHGGTLTLWRRSGGGNRFTLSIPLAASQPAGVLA